MLLLLGLIIWTLVPTDCSPYHNEHVDKECKKVCIMIAQCIKRRADSDGKSSCKETKFNEKCFPVCPENQTTLYDLNLNIKKQDRLLSNNDFLYDDDDDAIAEDRNSMMESDYNHEILTSKEIEDDIYKYIATSVKEKVLNRVKRFFLSMSDIASISSYIVEYIGLPTESLVSIQKKATAINKDLADQENRIAVVETKLTSLNNILEQLQSEIKELKDKLNVVQLECNDLDQNSRKNIVVIRGIPFKEGEDITNLFLQVSDVLGLKLSSKDIDYIYRLEPNTPAIIIVRLLRNSDSRQLMRLRKDRHVLTTRDIGWAEEDCKSCDIYINESLTPINEKVYTAAMALKKEGKIKNVWVRDGRILIKKEDESEPVEIKTSEDLVEFN